jgi:hypothetical protein
MDEIKYSLSKLDQFVIKLYSYYTYPKLFLIRIINGPIIIFLGLIIIIYLQINTFSKYIGLFSIFFGIYYCLRPFILFSYSSIKSSNIEETANLSKENKTITFNGQNVTSIIKIENIGLIKKIKWGYNIQINIEKRKMFLIIPYKKVKSGNLDIFIQEIKSIYGQTTPNTP